MDNATRAILIAGGFLIGMLIISLSMYLLDSFRTYYETTNNALELRKRREYNSFFEAYKNGGIVSGDVAYSLCSKCRDINNDLDSDYSTNATLIPTGAGAGHDLEQVFFFTEYFGHRFRYDYTYGLNGVVNSIVLTEE